MAYGRYGSYGTGAGNGSCLPVGSPTRMNAQALTSRGYVSEEPQRVLRNSHYAGQAYGVVKGGAKSSYGAADPLTAGMELLSSGLQVGGAAIAANSAKQSALAQERAATENRKAAEAMAAAQKSSSAQFTKTVAVGAGILGTVGIVGAILYFGTK